MADGIDLGAYFSRIGWGGDTVPTLANVSAIIRAHQLAVPFENLDALLGREVKLDLAGVFEKLVVRRRGGYCFEHATLFGAVLEALGYRVTRRGSRVVLMLPRDQAPRTHMFLTITLPDGEFVVGPGFGPFASPCAVPLVNRPDGAGDDATHWMVRDDAYWVLRMRRGDAIIDGWVSTFDIDNPIDFEMANYWTCMSPASPFKKMIMMSKLTQTGRITILNRDYTVRDGADTTTRRLADRAELRAVIAQDFGYDLPEVETMPIPAVPEWAG